MLSISQMIWIILSQYESRSTKEMQIGHIYIETR